MSNGQPEGAGTSGYKYTRSNELLEQIGITPYFIFYQSRIRDLCDAIRRYADRADEHCVYDWLQELYLLRHMMHAMKRKEFHADEMNALDKEVKSCVRGNPADT